jgi:sec-independent protein translocase protein TatC
LTAAGSKNGSVRPSSTRKKKRTVADRRVREQAKKDPTAQSPSPRANPADKRTLSGPENEFHAPFMVHLQELATRIKWSILFILVGCVIAYLFSEQLFHLLTDPLVKAFRGDKLLHFKSPVEPFFTYLTISVIGGLALAAPFVFFQLWRFVSPGLYKRERRLVYPFLIFSSIFFFGGITFGYLVVMPLGFKFLLSYAYEQPANFSLFVQAAEWLGTQVDTSVLDIPVAALEPTIMMQDYVTLVAKLLLAFGLIFELPLFIYFLAKIGLVTHRHLIKFFRYFAVLSFLLGAALTPPDIITQVLMAVPLVVMYLAATVVAYLITRKREAHQKTRETAADETDAAPDAKTVNGEAMDGEATDTDATGSTNTARGPQPPQTGERTRQHDFSEYESDRSEKVDPLEELENTLPENHWNDDLDQK